MDPRRKIFDEVSDDLHAFFERVGKVWIYEELNFLDLEPDMLTGEFHSDTVQSLIDFCSVNSGYHVISSKDGKVHNKLMPDATSYYLADGDADPSLFVDFVSRLSTQDFLQVGYTMFAPVLGKVKGGNDT